MECDECQKACLRAPNELILGQKIAATPDEEDMQKVIDHSDSSNTLTLEVINDAPLRTEFLPAAAAPTGRTDVPLQSPKKKTETPGGSRPKRREEKVQDGKTKMTGQAAQRQRSPKSKPITKAAPQPSLEAKAPKKNARTKPGVTHVSVTPDDEKSSSRSSSSSYSTRSSNSESGRNDQRARQKMDDEDF